ncbi:MAG: hypothetical protein ACTSU0_06635, partial [Alphaproteobacteria bacterium]
MITRNEIIRSLYGAWLLFLDRPGAIANFDTSYPGFWRSFQAILLIAPLFLVTLLAGYRNIQIFAPGAGAIDGATFFWSHMVSLGIDWVTLPIILAAIAGLIQITGTYTPYVVARNWSAVLIMCPFAVIGMLELAFGAAIEPLISILSILALAAALRLAYLVARRVMEVQLGLAIGIVVLDFFVSLFISTG